MSPALSDLWAAHAQMKKSFHGIGEPAIRIPSEMLLMSSKNPLEIHMTVTNLIALVGTVLANGEQER